MSKMKTYEVEIYISGDATFLVRAKSKSEARKKALTRLNRKSVSSFIHRHFPGNRRDIHVEDISNE